jgi:threonine synthase
LKRDQLDELPTGVWKYRDFLPAIESEEVVTLGEGGTPLLRAERLGAELGVRDLWIKDESRNPTGSFLDRGSTVLLSLAKKEGIKGCTCVTTGNLGASIAAYCAKAGISAEVQINPNTDQGKLYQMLAFGAKIETAPNRMGGLRSLEVTAANPYLLAGEKTTGFEIVQELGWKSPDVIVVPVGTGGHLSMIWRSISELSESGLARETRCRLYGVQIEGAGSPSTAGKKISTKYGFPLAELSESEPSFRSQAELAISDSDGLSLKTASAETIQAMGLLAKAEGIFAEPSAASAVAALGGAVREGHIDRAETVVCVITGTGLKDTDSVSRLAKETRRGVKRMGFVSPSPKVGETKVELLRQLQGKPRYAYELWLIFREKRGLSTASVYQHLSELEGFDLVRKKGSVMAKGRERILYVLTRRGADFLRITDRLEIGGRKRDRRDSIIG